MSASRMYVLSFNMEEPMCIYYGYLKTWIEKKHIKIGETDDWSPRLRGYINNYGCGSIKHHKNSPKCDGCGHVCNEVDKHTHHHVIVERTWKVSFGKSKRTQIEDQIRDNFKKLPGSTRDYFYKEDLSMIIEKMDELIKNMNTISTG